MDNRYIMFTETNLQILEDWHKNKLPEYIKKWEEWCHEEKFKEALEESNKYAASLEYRMACLDIVLTFCTKKLSEKTLSEKNHEYYTKARKGNSAERAFVKQLLENHGTWLHHLALGDWAKHDQQWQHMHSQGKFEEAVVDIETYTQTLQEQVKNLEDVILNQTKQGQISVDAGTRLRNWETLLQRHRTWFDEFKMANKEENDKRHFLQVNDMLEPRMQMFNPYCV